MTRRRDFQTTGMVGNGSNWFSRDERRRQKAIERHEGLEYESFAQAP